MTDEEFKRYLDSAEAAEEGWSLLHDDADVCDECGKITDDEDLRYTPNWEQLCPPCYLKREGE